MKKHLHIAIVFLLFLVASCATDKFETQESNKTNTAAVWAYDGNNSVLKRVIQELKSGSQRESLERKLVKNQVLWENARFTFIDNKKWILVPFLSEDQENVIGVLTLVKNDKGKTTADMTVRTRMFVKNNKLPFWDTGNWLGYFMALDKDILGIKNGNPGFKTIRNPKSLAQRIECDPYVLITTYYQSAYSVSPTGEVSYYGTYETSSNYEYYPNCYEVPDNPTPTDTGTGNGGSGGDNGGDNGSGASTSFNDKIINNLLKPCMQTIVNDLKTLTTGVSYTIQKFAGTTPNYNWEIKDGNLSGATGETDPPALYNKTTGTITTTFDSQAYLNATDLSWVRTILHESIHAYLATRFAIARPNFIGSYPQMVTEWGIMQNWNDVHHEEIARSIVNDIALALEEYGKSKGYNFTKQFYEDMSWAGLQSTATFKALPISDQIRILDTIAIELTGLDTNGNNKSQKGNNAGC